MKIGIYGGSFNPCHLMHKELVFTLLERNYFDRIIILPTGNYYKKRSLAKGEERIAMLKLMFESHPKVIISDYEFKNNLICTYRSLDYFQNLYKGDELYFIMGSDNLLHFDTWKRYEYILDNYNLLIIKRKNIQIEDQLKRFESYQGKIELVDLDLTDLNSSEIRKTIEEGNLSLVQNTLDERVYEYIQKRHLYTKDYVENPRIYKNDQEFLENYDSNAYEKMSITTDITLFSVSDHHQDNYRKNAIKSFSILLVRRTTPPFLGKWCLPGGFLSLDEKLLDCAKRVLFVEANIDQVYLNQIHTFSDIDRDIRGRILSVSYLGLIDKTSVENQLKRNAKFFDVHLLVENDILKITFSSEEIEFSCAVRKKYDAYGIISYEEIENDFLAFDNLQVIARTIDYLKDQVTKQDFVFHMLPKYFTLKELQLVYETILGKKLIDSVFRRTIKDKVKPTNEFKKDGGHRPSRLYMYNYKTSFV